MGGVDLAGTPCRWRFRPQTRAPTRADQPFLPARTVIIAETPQTPELTLPHHQKCERFMQIAACCYPFVQSTWADRSLKMSDTVTATSLFLSRAYAACNFCYEKFVTCVTWKIAPSKFCDTETGNDVATHPKSPSHKSFACRTCEPPGVGVLCVLSLPHYIFTSLLIFVHYLAAPHRPKASAGILLFVPGFQLSTFDCQPPPRHSFLPKMRVEPGHGAADAVFLVGRAEKVVPFVFVDDKLGFHAERF